MRKVLYATDCTRNSAPALRYAYRLSRTMDAELHVFHVYELLPVTVATIRPPQQLEERLHQEQKDIVTNFCATHLKNELHLNPVRVQVLESNFVTKSILSAVRTLKADLAIVGMKDSYTFRGIFSGNIANELLNKLDIPLLVLPNDMYYHGLSTLIYATDFEEADIYAIGSLVKIVESYGALIKVVHIPLKNESDAGQHMRWFENEVRQRISYPEIVFNVSDAEDVESGLHSLIRKERADMLVMMEREHSSIYDKLFHRDLVRTMEGEVSIPFLAFNQKRIRKEMKKLENNSYSFVP
ncbi:universal stress protein [Ulvibacterium sp.]|uniref:universal stress protein n=1 Tax=Ulvibacterium sp. TaxID=2665914 RepID=UPI003CC610C2